jgi:S1-C subfamily serine protease
MMQKLLFALLVMSAALVHALPAAAEEAEPFTQFPVPNGRFYSEASGAGGAAGYSITDEGGRAFWSEFQRLGGVEALGFPASRRFEQGGFVHQATQRFLLQWRPESGRIVYANAFDVLSAAGRDEWLRTQRMIPAPADFSGDAGLPWDQIVRRHLALLDQNATLKRSYLSDPDPVTTFGLPQSIADMGPAVVLRAQRAAFQLWKVRTSFAQPGEVTIVNGGDLVKEAGLLPGDSTTPEPASSVLVAPPGQPIQVSDQVVAQARRAADVGRRSTVQIVAQTAQGTSQGTGIVLDATHVLTNNHVVDGGRGVTVVLPDGRSVPAASVAQDRLTDLAVVTAPLPTGAVQPATIGDPNMLKGGEAVVAIGYTPFFPSPPTNRIGIYSGRDADVVDMLRSDSFVLPGDSGGPLFDLAGRVIGVNQSITIAPRGQQPLVGYSIDVQSAAPVVRELIANGRIVRPFLGVQTVSIVPRVAAQLGLPQAATGAGVTAIVPGSPAAQAGIRVGDVIVAIDGTPIRSTRDLAAVLSRHRVGDVATVSLVGVAGQRTVRATLIETPAS